MTPEYLFDAAVMNMRAGRREEAAAMAWEVARTQPKHADAWAMLARIEAEAGRFRTAVLFHQCALQATPNRHDLWCNAAIDAMSARMYKESEKQFLHSLELAQSYEGHYNYGNLLSAQMRVDEAVEQFEIAMKLDERADPQIRANLGVALFASGHWHEGFNCYRHRFNAPGFPPRPRFDYPQWRGESLEGKTILLYVEQGFGDEIMSLRFAKCLPLGTTVIIAVRPPMYRLARSLNTGGYIMLMYDEPPVKPDFMCALLDVPAFIDVKPETLPLKRGYLNAEDRSYKLEFPPGINVGICWASGKRDLQPSVAETAKQKSLSFEQLAAPLANKPGVNLISLQQHHGDNLHKYDVFDPMAGVTDFMDTAWIIDQLDLVITVDTSVAHLAGALGKPVWNLVRFDAMWPWMREGLTIGGPAEAFAGTCWYNSMRLYRQQKPFDWAGPMKRLTEDFAVFVDQHRCAQAAE
jgi:tetratricopeptide (TPR) repeat protein